MSKKVVELPKQVPWNTYFTLVEPETGEVKAYLPMAKQKRKIEGGGWIVTFQTALEWLAEKKLPQEQYRVLMYLMAKLDFSNYLRITQREIAEKLEMKQSSVSRAIKHLIEIDVLATGPRSGTAKTYRLNPRMAHKGRNQKDTVVEWDKLKKARERESSES